MMHSASRFPVPGASATLSAAVAGLRDTAIAEVSMSVFGDPEVTGKPAGDDLTEGKRTVLIALAMDGLATDQAQELDRSLGTSLSTDQVERLRHLIEKSGAREQVEQVIDQLTQTALKSLEQAEINEGARQALGQLAQSATQRTV